ncbi:glycosyltransferase family 4 protein [Lyngbya confervoides]|uniref:Glycosyltransferase family 4 protein n=1 Tax=Lyngbya confervoides BDU141951 TaxID=1574623 RepID=A0ABD4T7Q3_9CYAN|nr:glycosyltransferase family 4 protein [Lyngbya confervoides]MCM1984470.1 glycosyltransferase family 4 protein [Lyngbya confervoides BDU141951]
MKIAYICADPGVPVFGHKGGSIHVQEVIRAIQKQGATVELIAAKLGGDAPADLQSLTVHQLPPVPKGIPLAQREQNLLAINDEIAKILAVAGAYDLIYERYSLWSYAGMEFADARGIPGFLEVNAPLIEEQAKHRRLENRQAAEKVARRAFSSATQLMAVSQEVKGYLLNWVKGDRIQVIPNGVDGSRFAPQSERRPDSSPFTVGFVGTLKPWHGLEHLIDAFAQLQHQVPRARLLIVGEGPQRQTLELRVLQQGLEDKVQWTGAVPPTQIPDCLRQMTVAVAPYPPLDDFYFSPLKVMEYMAAGLPVVASQLGQIEEIITDGVTGLLCPPGESYPLSQTLERLWRSPHLCRRLGTAARQRVLTHYTWDSVAQRILSLAHAERSLRQQVQTPSKILINS